MRGAVDHPRDLVDDGLEMTTGDGALQRDRLPERLAAHVAEEAVREASAARRLHGGVDHLRDVHVEPGLRRVDREPA